MTIYNHTAGDRTPFTYLIKFIPTGQVYYGSRTGIGCHPSQLFNYKSKFNYTTSSKLVNSLLKQFGYKSFKYEIRKIFNSKEDCILWESRILSKFNVEDNSIFLNLDSKQRSDKAIQNNVKTICVSNIESSKCIRIPYNMPIPLGWVKGNINANRISSIKGRIWTYHPETLECKIIEKWDNLDDGYILGRPSSHSNSKTLLNKKNIHVTNGIITKLVSKLEPIPEGYIRGRSLKEKPKGKRKHKYMWIRNNKETRQIILGSNIPEGWWKGMLRNI